MLGSILLNPSAIGQVELAADQFSHDGHRRIYRAMAALAGDNHPIDPITLCEQLTQTGELEACGGVPYFSTLTENLPRSLNIAYYASIVRQKAALRAIVQTCHSTMQEAMEGAADQTDILERHDFAMQSIAHANYGEGYRAMHEVPTLDGVRDTPIEWLVKDVIAEDALNYLFGEYGTYKSWIATDIAVRVSRGSCWAMRRCKQKPVLYLDRETPEQYVNIRKQVLGLREGDQVAYWGIWLKEQPPSVWDRRLLEWSAKHRPLIIFDSLVRFLCGKENSTEDMAKMAEYFRRLTNAGATVLIVAHKSDKPGAARFRGASEILAGGDLGWSIERRSDEQRHIVDMRCLKSRASEEGKMSIKRAEGGFLPLEYERLDSRGASKGGVF